MSIGPKKSGFNPVKEYYRCPVKNCNFQFRGDEKKSRFPTSFWQDTSKQKI